MLLKNKLIYIIGLPGGGKSFLAMYLSTFYPRIVSNFKIYYDGQKINEDIVDMYDIENLTYQEEKGCCILDEGALNIAARRGMSEQNLDFIKLGVLSRKKNIDIIVISQLERLLDVAIRELCSASFEIDSYFSGKDYLMFNIQVKNRHGQFVKSITADLIKFTRKYHWTYDTLETSEITNKKNIDREVNAKKYFDEKRQELFKPLDMTEKYTNHGVFV